MDILGNKGVTYEYVQRLGKKDGIYNLHECRLPDGRPCILKIAATPSENGILDREALILEEMAKIAERLEIEYTEQAGADSGRLNYQLCFPELIETFISDEQGGRRINVLCLSKTADELSELVPLSFLLERYRVCVDPKTAAWILGKFLKLLVFAHACNISVGSLDLDNLLINKEQHLVAVVDWSQANIIADGTGLTSQTKSSEISQVAQAVIRILGGNLETGSLLEDEQLEDDEFQILVWNMARGAYSDAKRAHAEFYELIMAMWPRGFHPYTDYSISAE